MRQHRVVINIKHALDPVIDGHVRSYLDKVALFFLQDDACIHNEILSEKVGRHGELGIYGHRMC